MGRLKDTAREKSKVEMLTRRLDSSRRISRGLK
jgi:hypothetical protein